jgi:hypothetical protein
MEHPVAEVDLALYASGDLPAYRRAPVWLHVRGCDSCHSRIQAYQTDHKHLRSTVGELPAGIETQENWDRLAEEMTANIHLGLAAGECVAPRSRRRTSLTPRFASTFEWAWRPVAVVGGLMTVLTVAWWLNMPASDTQALSRVMHGIMHGGRRSVLAPGGFLAEESGPVVEATPAGVELRENGGALGVSQSGLRPLTVSVSVQGSASAHYIDTDTGQMTITSVYAQ